MAFLDAAFLAALLELLNDRPWMLRLAQRQFVRTRFSIRRLGCAFSVTMAFGVVDLSVRADVAVYQILPGSTFLDDCPICDRVSRPVPMTGSFTLRTTGSNPLFTDYAVEAFEFSAGLPGNTPYRGVGSGTFRDGGEVARVQTWVLNLTVWTDSWTNQVAMTNAPVALPAWPNLSASLGQTNGTPMRTESMTFNAEPLIPADFRISSATNGAVSVSWSGSPISSLLVATRLSPPDWTEVKPAAAVVEGRYVVSVPVTNKAAYYRLRFPQ
jgi:hypothetical protein